MSGREKGKKKRLKAPKKDDDNLAHKEKIKSDKRHFRMQKQKLHKGFFS